MALSLKQALTLFWAHITAQFVKQQSGKGLSTNDFTNEEKTKLAGLTAGANGTITNVTAGNGLTGGGNSGSVTLNVVAGSGLTANADSIGHSNSVTAATASEGGSARTLTFGGSFNVPSVTYDAQGHITSKGSIALKLPAEPEIEEMTNAEIDAICGQTLAVAEDLSL